MIYGESNEWVWSGPDPLTGRCPTGFRESSWGCVQRASLGAPTSIPNKGIWIGIGGLVLSAGIMIAMGFHKPVQRPARTRR